MWAPVILTFIFVFAGLLLMLILLWTAWRHRTPPINIEAESSNERRNFGPVETNRWIQGLRLCFLILLLVVFGFHSYWVFWADSNKDSQFNRAKRFDARNLRLAESGLKGWVLDRTGKLENALIRYRSDAGIITREYPLGAAAVHVTGYSDFVFGAGGFEAAFRDWLTEPTSTYNQIRSPNPVGKDLTVSIDSALQREAFNLLQSSGKPSAAVVLLLPNNEVLAMASYPSFDPTSIRDESTWRRLSDQAENYVTQPLSPLVNRALGTLVTGGGAFYYRPGSTFKTFTAAAAIDLGVTEERFTCRSEGFTPAGSNRPIRDYGGEVHGTVGLHDAFRLSCNQYFAQLGLKLGKERLANYARRMRMAVSRDEKRERSLDLWQPPHASKDQFDYIFAPLMPRMDLSPKATNFDVALQSFGQGYDDLSLMSMALIAAAAAGQDGSFVAPTFEPGAPPRVIGQFISSQSAARLRAMMRSVVESGTAAGIFSSPAHISAGGKTGTADRDGYVYDKHGNPIVDRVNEDGRKEYRVAGFTDSWFVGFAPADNPQIAFAVIVENGGQGARAAAPLAAKIVAKAASLDYLKTSASKVESAKVTGQR
ncbi:MAG TPA: penicillin-binding transpeptidase domain-containing protein [Blastocatellia bacterium]|nr:penicillin-binding transpeptidase domain-containing protein [Blastocatellia bacterium]